TNSVDVRRIHLDRQFGAAQTSPFVQLFQQVSGTVRTGLIDNLINCLHPFRGFLGIQIHNPLVQFLVHGYFHYNERVSANCPLSLSAEWGRGSAVAPVDAREFTVVETGKLPAGVLVVKGERAGVRSRVAGTSAGPTGAAWVDSNGWRIRLARTQNPSQTIWVETEESKPDEVVPVEKYLVGIADT